MDYFAITGLVDDRKPHPLYFSHEMSVHKDPKNLVEDCPGQLAPAGRANSLVPPDPFPNQK